MDVYINDYQGVIDSFEQLTNEKVILLIRLHPNISEYSSNIKTSENIINVTAYPDMQELMLIADYAISDYSSASIEFSMTNKPSFLYVNDIELYEKERGFYFELEELPYIKCYSEEQLKQEIIGFDRESYERRLNLFFERVQLMESGNASKSVADVVLRKIQEN